MEICVCDKFQKQKTEERCGHGQCGRYSFASDNRGLSLVELMVALAITVIIMGAAMLFLHTAIKNYEFASGQIALQKESQVAMEQMLTWVMEGNQVEEKVDETLVICDYPRPIDTTKLPDGYQPEEYTYEASSGIYSKVVTTRVLWQSGNRIYMVKKLYHIKNASSSVVDVSDIINNKSDYEKIENCVADNVEAFSIDVNAKQTEVEITMDLKEGKQTFSLVNKATVRNDKID